MLQLLKLAVDEISSRVSDGEAVKSTPSEDIVLEEKVLICKNNVCVHPPYSSRPKHIPGYFNLKLVEKSMQSSDLLLCWVPNTLMAASSADNYHGQDELLQELELLQSDLPAGNDDSKIQTQENPNDSKTDTFCEENVYQSPQSEQKDTFFTPYGAIFSINLIDMKAVKLFFADKEFINGQLIVINLENQYKVFHFHFGGISRIGEIFAQWEGCKEDTRNYYKETMQRIFNISKNIKAVSKTESGAEVHPEDGTFAPLNLASWKSLLNPMGQIEDVNNFRKHVFFSGLSKEVRKEVWKFLLYYYPVQSTSFERGGMKKEKEVDYRKIIEKRVGLSGIEYENFCKDIQLTVDKDVIRTDRSHPYFAGKDNPNIEKMRNILLNYAVFNPVMGYTQGMSDLLSPLLATIEDEVDTFWSFVGLMEFSLFATTPKDHSMDKSLGFLRELLRVVYPEFYIHCLMQDEDLSLLFCHRWLVLCFKREFVYDEVLTLWEACWSRYQTDYFQIFICVALLRLYGKKCIESKMRMDEMMQHFMDLAMQFDGPEVLRESRSLLYKFRTFQVIPCTLEELLSGPGVWDGGIQPDIECMSRHRKCCLDSQKNEIN